MTITRYNIAQINIAKLKYPLTDPRVKDFVDSLERINNLAESTEGFVWRLKDVTGNATSIKAFDDDMMIVNMSVWKRIEDLFNFTYRSDHIDLFRRKGEWFNIMKESHLALWWVEEGKEPTPEEGKQKLAYLEQHGSTPKAFTFKKQFLAEEIEKNN